MTKNAKQIKTCPLLIGKSLFVSVIIYISSIIPIIRLSENKG